MGTIHRARGKLNVKKKNTNSVTGKAKSMCSGMANHPSLFNACHPPLPDVLTQIDVVDKAETLAATKSKGAASARNVERSILVGMLETELTYVQGVADKAATYEQAIAIFQAAALDVVSVPQRSKAVLAAKQGPAQGTVALEANLAALTKGSHRKHFLSWQYTADGGKTWVDLPSTPKARTSVSGLTPLATYGFRVSVTMSDDTTSGWSQVVAFLVH